MKRRRLREPHLPAVSCKLCTFSRIQTDEGWSFMKYINACSVLPDSLIREIQRYVKGEAVYIPNPEGVRRKWGEKSGNRAYLAERNRDIRIRFQEGDSIDRLADLFCLSVDSIKKIVYQSRLLEIEEETG